jgi:hypothetical protein
MFAGVCTTVIMAPGERVKCLLQVKERLYIAMCTDDSLSNVVIKDELAQYSFQLHIAMF